MLTEYGAPAIYKPTSFGRLTLMLVSSHVLYIQPHCLCTLSLYFYSRPCSSTINLVLIQLIVTFLKLLKCHCSILSQLRPAKWSDRASKKARGPLSPSLFPFLQLRSLSLLNLVFQLCCPAVLLVLDGLCDGVPEAQRFVWKLGSQGRCDLWRRFQGCEVDEEDLCL